MTKEQYILQRERGWLDEDEKFAMHNESESKMVK